MEKSFNNSSDSDLAAIVKPYLTRWYWFFISVLIFSVFAFIYIHYKQSVYNIKSAVLIKDAKKSLGASSGVGDMGILEGLSGFGGMSTNSIENELEIFKTKKLVRDIVSSNELQTTIYSKVDFRKKELFGDTAPIKIHVVNEKKNKKFPKKSFFLTIEKNRLFLRSEEYNFEKSFEFEKLISLPFANIIILNNEKFDKVKAEKISSELEIKFSTLESAATSIHKMVQVELADKDATVISLSIDYPEVEKAKTIINGLISAYNKDAILDKNSESQKTIEFIDDRILMISRELGDVESEKEKFKTDNRITDLMTEAKINLESSADAKKKQLELDSQLELNNDLISYLKKQDSYELLPVNIGLESNESNANIISYNKMVLDRNTLLENATPQNPLVIDITKQINSMKESVSESLLKNKAALQFALNEYQSEQNTINNRIVKIPLQEKLFRSLERQQQIKENLYLLLLKKREETAISLAIVAPKARIVEPVVISDKPVSPKKNLTLLFAITLGLLMPLGFIYIKELINNKIITKNDLKKLSNIPIITEIPSIKKNEDHLVKFNDFSSLAESFRILTTNMGFMLNNTSQESKVIFVTSSIKGEGKTFISMNLALTLCNDNSVIIIGADIRNPQLQRYNQNNKSIPKGLTEFLYDDSTLVENIIFKNPINDKCDIIYSGMIPPNPTELLKNGRLGVLLEILRKEYQYIIIDTAPLLLVTDTLTIAKYSNLELYVTRSNFTENALIEFANDIVESGKLNNVAFVINDVKKENSGYGNKYGYGYNNK